MSKIKSKTTASSKAISAAKIEKTGFVVFGADEYGKPKAAYFSGVDQDILAKATVQATVHLSQSDTPEGLKHAIEGRIQALANVHRLFAESRWTGAELHKLVCEELAAYCQDQEARVRIDGPNVLLEPDAAQTMAVTLHELATNAAKHGALSVLMGKVQVDWSRASDGRVVLRWTEADGPPATLPTRRGFGTRVMEDMIRRMNGEIYFDWRAEGLACEIAIPT